MIYDSAGGISDAAFYQITLVLVYKVESFFILAD